MDSSQAPRVGTQPYNDSDHATQLLADIAALRDFRTGLAQRSKGRNLPWTAVNSVFESVEGYIKKSRDQPSIKELQTDLHAAEKANGIPRKDVILIKNTLESLTGGQNAKFTPQQPTQAISKNREVMVKVNDSSPNSEVRRATRIQIMEHVNDAICSSKEKDLVDSRIQVRVIKRHPSGDLTLYTDCKEHTDLLIRHRTEWEGSMRPSAKALVPTYGILVHGISTELDVANTIEASHQGAQITFTRWLKKDVKDKRASTMVVEFDNPQHADKAILDGLIMGAQLFTCEYYDRSCKLKQCFRCQKYGHIETHCKAVEACSYCAGCHDSRTCKEQGKRPKSEPKCANCGGKHQAWSPHCVTRKTAYLQLEEVRNRRPHTHQDSVVPSTTWTVTQESTQANTTRTTIQPYTQTNEDSGNTGTDRTQREAFPALEPLARQQRARLPSQRKKDAGDKEPQTTGRKRRRPS